MEERIPPHSIEAEKSVLGAALLSKDALLDVVEIVKAGDFYDSNHREIFEAIQDLYRRSAPGGRVDRVGGAEKEKQPGDGRRQSLYRLPFVGNADYQQCDRVR